MTHGQFILKNVSCRPFVKKLTMA